MGCCSSNNQETYLNSQRAEVQEHLQSLRQQTRTIASIRESYTIIKTLGSGSLGSAFLVKEKRTGLERTAKELVKSLMDEKDLDTFFTELFILKNLDHPSIMRIYEVIETNTRIYVISEYLSGGQLFEKLAASGGISERLAARYLLDIVLALNYCHKRNIIHRDIKPENLLFESDAPDAHLKIVDFGISRINKIGQFQLSVGAVEYMAPERFKGQVSPKSDIWSAGVILYTMLCGRLPFQSSTDAETTKLICQAEVNVRQGTAWTNISEDAKALVIRMLKKDPRERPSAEEVLSNKWVVSYTRSTINEFPISPDVLANLEKFHVIFIKAKNKLEKSIFSFISTQVMTSIEKQILTDMFLSLDKNGDGTLSKDEIEEGYDALGIPAPISLNDLLKKLDGEGNGSINYNDFLTASQDWSKLFHQKELEGVFKLYDSAGDGVISVDELKEAIPGIHESEWAEFLSQADTNKDGFLSFEELKNYLTGHHSCVN